MTHDTLKFLYSFQQSTLTVLPGPRTPSHYVWKRYWKHTPVWKPCATGVHVGARGGTLWHLVFHPQLLRSQKLTLDKVCQPCDTSMDDGVNHFRLCWAGRHQQRLIVQPHTVHCLSSFRSTGGTHEMFFCVAKMTEWYIMFVKQVMWVPSTSSISFLNLLRPLFSWLVYFLFSFFATHSASAIWCVSQNGRFHGWHGSESHRCPQSMVLCNVKLGWMWDIFPLDICKKGYYGWSSKSETNSQGAGGNLAQVEILVFVIFWGSILDICWLVQHWVSLVVQWVCLQFLDVSLFAISIDQRTSDMKKVPCLLNGSV